VTQATLATALKDWYEQAIRSELAEEARRWRERENWRGRAMSDALHELKAELGRRPTLAEVRERADRLQHWWHIGVPLCSERHPVDVRFSVRGRWSQGNT